MQPTFLEFHINWKLEVGNFLSFFSSLNLFGAVRNIVAGIFKIWRPSHQVTIFFFAQLASFSRV